MSYEMATFQPGDRVSALWGDRWFAGVVDDVIDGGRAYEIAWADEETCNEVPMEDVRALAPAAPGSRKHPRPGRLPGARAADRVAASRSSTTAWQPGAKAYVSFGDKWYVCTLMKQQGWTWTVAWENGDEEPRTMHEDYLKNDAPPEAVDHAQTPLARPKKRAKTAPAVIGPPTDGRLLELLFRFLYHRATTRRLMYPTEDVVGADGRPLPAATLPAAGKDGFGHGPLIQSLCKMGNVGRGLDSGTRTTGAFVRAKLAHAQLEPGSTAWIGQAILMCVHEMDNWRLDVSQGWTKGTPKGWFRAPKRFGALGGCNFPSSIEEINSFVPCAARLWKTKKPKFAGTFQNQGKRLLQYLPERLVQIADVVSDLTDAKTWADACAAFRKLSGVGAYVGGQALCTFFYGVCEGSMALFNPALDVSTMNSFCSFGPGPEGVIKKLWKSNGAVVARIAWLASNAEAQFARLGLAFPFQKGADGTPRRLTAVDLEHALCYFSRYLSAHDALQAKGARTVHAKLTGLITRKKIQRPSIKWAAKLTPKNAARRCAKWIKDDAAGKHEAFTS